MPLVSACVSLDPGSCASRRPEAGTAIAVLIRLTEDVAVNWFNLSFVGWVILIAALAIAAYKLGAAPVWIAIGALAMLGVGIIVSVSKSKPQI